MISLIINHYIDQNPIRQHELDECLRINANNKLIDNIICVQEWPSAIQYDAKIKVIGRRPTYNDLFDFAVPDSWNIIANTDIYFDHTLSLLHSYTPDDFLALARYDISKDKTEFRLQPDTQDAWIFYGKLKPIDADFTQGTPGCDNSIAYKAQQAQYNVINPSLSIKTYHLHRSNIRHYSLSDKVPGPYLTVWPSF